MHPPYRTDATRTGNDLGRSRAVVAAVSTVDRGYGVARYGEPTSESKGVSRASTAESDIASHGNGSSHGGVVGGRRPGIGRNCAAASSLRSLERPVMMRWWAPKAPT